MASGTPTWGDRPRGRSPALSGERAPARATTCSQLRLPRARQLGASTNPQGDDHGASWRRNCGRLRLHVSWPEPGHAPEGAASGSARRQCHWWRGLLRARRSVLRLWVQNCPVLVCPGSVNGSGRRTSLPGRCTGCPRFHRASGRRRDGSAHAEALTARRPQSRPEAQQGPGASVPASSYGSAKGAPSRGAAGPVKSGGLASQDRSAKAWLKGGSVHLLPHHQFA